MSPAIFGRDNAERMGRVERMVGQIGENAEKVENKHIEKPIFRHNAAV